ncbi:unnamed protein product, partial [Didymodactylos carnosus]
CDLKLLKTTKECKEACQSAEFDLAASCLVGCDPNAPKISQPAAETKPNVDTVQKVVENNDEHPKSIILVRLRQRPLIQLPSFERVFNSDPFQMFDDMLKQMKEKASVFEKTFQSSPESIEQPNFGPVLHFAQNILSDTKTFDQNEEDSSSSESSEEKDGNIKDRHSMINRINVQHPREHHQWIQQHVQPINSRLQQFFTNVKTEWNDLIRKQPKIPIWIFICILLTSSAILWYMAISMCRHAPSRNLSIRSQELIFHPYESSDVFAEKEKIQPDELYETQPLAIKVKLSNI